MKFKNRKAELKALEGLYKEKSPKLIILYGKRRVGKTALLMEFAKRHKGLYLVARQEGMNDQLKKMSEEIAAYFNDEVLKANPFQNYDALFTYLTKKKLLIFFDEFPYLVEANKALPSILQEYWDKKFSKQKPFIILCGSSIRMMESLLGYKSPLYGRRTEQILLEPLTFADSQEFFPQLKNEQKIQIYSILGGTPAYLLEFDYAKSLAQNIKENILQKNKFLYQDVQFVLQQELNEPRVYYSILQSIAKGNTKLGQIMNDIGIEKIKITRYLSILQELHLIERRVPITEKNKEKSRKGIYLLKDNYFKFWFKFVFGNNDYIEQNKQDLLYKEKISPELPAFTGIAFEEIALEWIKKQKKYDKYLFGRWWDKDKEIDIVGINKINKKILFGEVKWKSLTQNQVKNELEKLKEKATFVKWPAKKQEYIIIAKKIQNKESLRKQGHIVFDLDDVIKV